MWKETTSFSGKLESACIDSVIYRPIFITNSTNLVVKYIIISITKHQEIFHTISNILESKILGL